MRAEDPPPTSFSRPHKALMVSGEGEKPKGLLPAICWISLEGIESDVEYLGNEECVQP